MVEQRGETPLVRTSAGDLELTVEHLSPHDMVLKTGDRAYRAFVAHGPDELFVHVDGAA